MEKLNIAVVLVTFNRCEMLMKNLHSLKKQGPLTYYIIDNNSSDDTQFCVERFAKDTEDKVFYFNTKANLGGAGGFAFGCEKALASDKSFTHLWLADDDVTFYPDCLESLRPYADQKTILQPMRYDLDGNNAEASATSIDLESIFILNHKRNSVMGTKWEDEESPFDIQNIPFEGPLVPRQIFDSIGIPDKRYFIFSDDLDFSLSALQKGFAIKCIPKARMTRLRPAEPSYKPDGWKSYFVYRNFFHIHKKFGGNWLVQHRPYLLALLVSGYCLFTGNFKGIAIIKDALFDGMSDDFRLNNKYIP